MEVKFYGGNCIRITTKQRSIIIDDNLDALGAKTQLKEGDTAFYTSRSLEPSNLKGLNFLVDTPGEFELGSLMIQGYAVRAFSDEPDQKTGVLYKFVSERICVVVTGHIHPDVDSSLLESLSPVEAVFAPVGGNDKTLDAVSVQKIVNKINPRYFVPTHYEQEGINYPTPQDSLKKLLEELGHEAEEMDVLKLKPSMNPEHTGTQIITLKRSV